MSNGLKTFFTELADVYRSASGSEEKIVANTLPTLFEELLANGGGSDLIAYVTFMSEDGTTHLFDMPVLKGDDCKDPIKHGDIETPTKESNNYYNYSYSGWSSTSGGNSESNILKNVTENKTVYSSFTSSTRYYTVRFYDGDTLLTTKQTTYDGSVTYTPTKEGYDFVEWNPSPTNVKSDVNCYAAWKEKVGFAVTSWSDISAISQSGNAQNYFNLGDRKSVTVSWSDTSTETIEVEILNFIDGGGIELGMVDVFKKNYAPYSLDGGSSGTLSSGGYYNNKNGYSNSLMHLLIIPNQIIPCLEQEFQNVLVEHERKCYVPHATNVMNATLTTCTGKAFFPSVCEMGLGLADGTKFTHKTLIKSNDYWSRTSRKQKEYYYFDVSVSNIGAPTSPYVYSAYVSLVFRV